MPLLTGPARPRRGTLGLPGARCQVGAPPHPGSDFLLTALPVFYHP